MDHHARHATTGPGFIPYFLQPILLRRREWGDIPLTITFPRWTADLGIELAIDEITYPLKVDQHTLRAVIQTREEQALGGPDVGAEVGRAPDGPLVRFQSDDGGDAVFFENLDGVSSPCIAEVEGGCDFGDWRAWWFGVGWFGGDGDCGVHCGGGGE